MNKPKRSLAEVLRESGTDGIGIARTLAYWQRIARAARRHIRQEGGK